MAARQAGTYEFARVEADRTLADARERRRRAVVDPVHLAGPTTCARGRLNRVGDLGSGLDERVKRKVGTHIDTSVDAGGEEEGEGGDGRESVHRERLRKRCSEGSDGPMSGI